MKTRKLSRLYAQYLITGIIIFFPFMERAIAQEALLPLRIGGWCEKKDAYYSSPLMSDTSFFSALFTKAEEKTAEVDNFNINPPTAALAGLPRHTIKIELGSWTGTEYLALARNYDPNGDVIQPNKGGVYIAWEPVSGKARRIGSYSGTQWGNVFCGMAYDPTDSKVYLLNRPSALSPALSETAEQFLVSMSTSSIDTTRVGGANALLRMDDGSEQTPRLLAIACNTEGFIYGISIDSCIYRIDKTTARMSRVVKTDIQIKDYSTQAFFSVKDNRMFLYHSFSYQQKRLYCVDLKTGKTTYVANMPDQDYGLFHHYYTKDVPPKNVSQLESAYNPQEKATILSWVNPTHNYNEETLNNLDSILVWKIPASGAPQLIAQIPASTAGATQSYKILEKEEGIFTYGLSTHNKTGQTCYDMVRVRSHAYDLQVPYSLGFEDSDNLLPVTVAEGALITDDSYTDSIHSGSKALKFTAKTSSDLKTDNSFSINSLRLEKGNVYKLSYWIARGTASTTNAQVDLYLNGENVQTHDFGSGKEKKAYVKDSVVFPAKETGPVSFSFRAAPRYSSFAGPIYIDDIEITKIIDNTTPDSIRLYSCRPADSGRLQAIINLRTPSLDAGGNRLALIDGIAVASVTGSGSSVEITPVDTIHIQETDKDTTVYVKVPKADYYTLQFTPFNATGACPFPVQSAKTDFIGPDTIPVKPAEIWFFPNTDGSTRLVWSKVDAQGPKGGFFGGEITGYEILQQRIYANTVLSTTSRQTLSADDTVCVFNADTLNFYKYTVTAIRNHAYKGSPLTAYGFNGLSNNERSILDNRNRPMQSLYDFAPFAFDKVKTNSTICQNIYLDSLMGGAMFIDTLYYFSNQKIQNLKRPVRIFMGKTDKKEFTAKDDFIDWFEMEEVFNDSLETKAENMQLVAVPIKPYFHDGTGNLLITVIRPQTDFTNNNENFLCAKFLDTKRQLTAYSNKILIDTLKSLNGLKAAINAKPAQVSASSPANGSPLLIASSVNGLCGITGKVTRHVSGAPLPGTSVSIIAERNDEKVIFDYELTTADDGSFHFRFLPENHYTITFHRNGFVDSVCPVDLTAGQTLNMEISLDDGQRVKISGTVLLANDNTPVTDADIAIAGPFLNSNIKTDAQGRFVFEELYNTTPYLLTVSKKNLLTQTFSITTPANQDTAIQLIMREYPFPISELKGQVGSQGYELSWKAPVDQDGKTVNPESYKVYRIDRADTADQSAWNLISPNGLSSLGFTDSEYRHLSPGIFMYAVEAVYTDNFPSKACFSDSIFKDLYFRLTVHALTDGAPAQGTYIRLVQQDLHASNIYEGTTSENGSFTVERCHRGLYALSAGLDFHQNVTASFSISGDTTVLTPLLIENKSVPVITQATAGPQQGEINLSWTLPGFDDNDDVQTVNPIGFCLYDDSVIVDTVGLSVRSYTFSHLFAGKHTVEVSALFASGESDRANSVIEVVSNHRLQELDCRIYPNPSLNGVFHLCVPLGSHISVFTPEGKEIRSFEADSDQIELQIDEAKGIYFVLVRHHNGRRLLKAIR